jgi:hypothetical protein
LWQQQTPLQYHLKYCDEIATVLPLIVPRVLSNVVPQSHSNWTTHLVPLCTRSYHTLYNIVLHLLPHCTTPCTILYHTPCTTLHHTSYLYHIVPNLVPHCTTHLVSHYTTHLVPHFMAHLVPHYTTHLVPHCTHILFHIVVPLHHTTCTCTTPCTTLYYLPCSIMYHTPCTTFSTHPVPHYTTQLVSHRNTHLVPRCTTHFVQHCLYCHIWIIILTCNNCSALFKNFNFNFENISQLEFNYFIIYLIYTL